MAYKIGRVVECCLREKIEPWGFPDFIAGHGTFTKAYNYAVKTYPRSVDTEEAVEIDPESSTEAEDQSSDKPTASGDDVFEQDTESDSPESDQHRTPKPRKPDWAKSEHSVNFQAVTDCDFSTLMAVGPVDERWVLIGRRPFDGDYVDLCIKEVAPEGSVVMLEPPADG